MGVPGLLSFFQNFYPLSISKTINFSTNGLYLDMNGLVHPWAQRVFGYGEGKDLKGYEGMTRIQLEEELFRLIVKEISSLTTTFKPSLLVVAFDGPAPLAKIQQQRSRRYRNDDPLLNKYGWDSSAFSPGTDLMERLSLYIQSFLKREKKNLAPQIIYSSHRVPGEGEHKMMKILRQQSGGNHVVVGKDADLILLAMLTGKQVYVYRQEDFPMEGYLVIDAKKLGNQVMGGNIVDFLVLTFFIGNDFVRALPEMTNIRQALPFLMEEYKILNRPLTRLIDGYYHVDWLNLEKLLMQLTDKKLYRMNDKFLTIQSDKPLTNTTLMFQQAVVTLGSTKYVDPILFEKVYYRHVFGIWDSYVSQPAIDKLPVGEMCEQWFITINWILLYYQGAPVNIAHQFIFHYTPLVKSLTDYIRQVKDFKSWSSIPLKSVKPFTPLEALSSVLPPSSFDLIPPELQKQLLLTIPDLYPLHFRLDKLGYIVEFNPSIEGLQSLPEIEFDRPLHEHKIIPLLPFVSYTRVKDMFKLYKLSEKSRELNTIQQEVKI